MAKKLRQKLPYPKMVLDKKSLLFQNYDKELFSFQKRLAIEFNNEGYLKAAFVHSSFLDKIKSAVDMPSFAEGNSGLLNDYGSIPISPDRLALLGLTLTSRLVTANVFEAFPNVPSKVIDEVSSVLSGRSTIAKLADNLGIAELIVLEYEIAEIDAEKHLPFSREDVICDAFYALIGAIYQDQGSQAVESFIEDFVMTYIEDEAFRDQIKIPRPMQMVSELATLNKLQEKPEARLLFQATEDTDLPLYVVGIFCGKQQLGEGASHTLKKAEIAACENAIFSCMWMKETRNSASLQERRTHSATA